MEMNVSISFRFEDEDIQRELTEAFVKVYDYPNQNKYSSDLERANEFKALLTNIFDTDDFHKFTDQYSNDLEGLEYIRINKGSTTMLDFLSGSTGDMFADDFTELLK
ncbi:MAG: hypothetical protein KZQ93_20240 [Candidatus Thiodiazotropha sp. (ex Monitilora ramsayi)]|nr:hypothetical protein [Candidatus Thiodiazotropha sp. (ex Monitilora ramsayi)]